jgi:hypothetical protein
LLEAKANKLVDRLLPQLREQAQRREKISLIILVRLENEIARRYLNFT